VPLDRPGADTELGADLRVREPIAGQPGDLQLLGSEPGDRLLRTLAHPLAGGQQLVACTFREGGGSHAGEHLVS
jgi:hypothetical protein